MFGWLPWQQIAIYSLARIWKIPVRKKRPPFCRVKSWQKNMKRDRRLKMMDRIIRAWTAWIHSEREREIWRERDRERERGKQLFYKCNNNSALVMTFYPVTKSVLL